MNGSEFGVEEEKNRRSILGFLWVVEGIKRWSVYQVCRGDCGQKLPVNYRKKMITPIPRKSRKLKRVRLNEISNFETLWC